MHLGKGVFSFSDKDERCLVIRTSRDVFSGEELLHNYGPMLGIHSYEKRQVMGCRHFYVCF